MALSSFQAVPVAKMGQTICGEKFQACEPGANKPSSVVLAVPAAAVRVMVGKKAARAAPMLALAASS